MKSDNKLRNAGIFVTTALMMQFLSCGWLYLRQRRRAFYRRRRFWVREILRERSLYGAASTLVPTMRRGDTEYFFDYFRMSPDQFNDILSKVEDLIRKKDTKWRNAISTHDRLALTLRFLASGETIRSLSFQFRIGRSTVSNIISETCSAIWNVLSPVYVKFPTTNQEWEKIAEEFQHRWQFPHCLGAIDGKHVVIECPINSGSKNFNHKSSFSKVLLAVCDAQYRFIMVDIGNAGSESDGGIFLRSAFGRGLTAKQFDLPPPKHLEKCGVMPFMFVGDEAFPLNENVMRPYPKRNKNLGHNEKVFNYRLSRARRTIENAFGILSSRWRIFRRPLKLACDNIDNSVKAAICLHNYLMSANHNQYCPPGYVDTETWRGEVIPGEWRAEADDITGLEDVTKLGTNTSSRYAMNLRSQLAKYFSEKYIVPWQENVIYRA